MEETNEVAVVETEKFPDQIAVTVLGGLAGLLANKVVEKVYRSAMKTYRLRKAAA